MLADSLSRWSGKFISTIAAISLIVSSVYSSIAFAQSTLVDDEPPQIMHTVVGNGNLGEQQLFSAEVTDNVGVVRVTLHYRFAGQSDYRDTSMTQESGSQYIGRVETELNSGSPIEYYIDATDAAGNNRLDGFTWDPHKRWLARVSEPGSQSGEPENATKKSNLLWYVLGGVAILALAGLAGGGGSSSGGTPDDDATTITFTVGAP